MMEQGKKESKSVRILDLIEATGDAGMRFTDIQRALWKMTHIRPFTKELRGYWCTNLCGGMHYHAGLLNLFCVKGGDGRWRRNGLPHGGRPWAVMSSFLPKRFPKAHRELVFQANVRKYGEKFAQQQERLFALSCS